MKVVDDMELIRQLENQELRKTIREEVLALYTERNVTTLPEYIETRFDTEEVAFDEIKHLGFVRNLYHFHATAVNKNGIRFEDGIWHFIKIKKNNESALYYLEPLVAADKVLVFCYEERTNYWGCNGQLLFKELSVLPCNPERTLKGWDDEGQWEMYIDHRILIEMKK